MVRGMKLQIVLLVFYIKYGFGDEKESELLASFGNLEYYRSVESNLAKLLIDPNSTHKNI